jgi:hypothetical protein
VSVVCPFYNEEDGIVDAVDRMNARLGEQFDDWELVLVDDGSTDKSPSWPSTRSDATATGARAFCLSHSRAAAAR